MSFDTQTIKCTLRKINHMKRILTLLALAIGLTTATLAQTKPSTPAKPTTAAKPAAAKVKADGTPDMRFKENKEAVKATGQKKADGTPDMRFKENKKPTTPPKKKG